MRAVLRLVSVSSLSMVSASSKEAVVLALRFSALKRKVDSTSEAYESHLSSRISIASPMAYRDFSTSFDAC